MDLDQELLCSPRKIRRLNKFSPATLSANKHDTQQKISQGSQESRATSTPTKRSLTKRLSISSDISSINVKSSSVKSSSLVESDAGNGTSNVISLLEELTIDESGSEFLHRPNPKLLRGKTWKYLKPKFEGTLYFKVFSNFDDIEDVAFQCLDQLRFDEKNGVLTVVKFFVDLCGYQSAPIHNHFDFEKDFSISCEKVIKLLEFDLVDNSMLQAKTYIFYESEKRKSKLGIQLATATSVFLEKFFTTAYHQNTLFSKPFHKCIFQFLFYMCQSILRPIRHTGVTLVRIILMVLNNIYLRIVKEFTSRDTPSTDGDRLPIEKEIKYSEKYMKHFFGVFAKNSFIPDPKLCMLRAKNVLEMGTWMIDLPQIYFENCTTHLNKSILDESEYVRLSTIQVWKHLIKSKSIQVNVEYLHEIVQKVQGRLKDIHLNVVLEAVDFFSVLLDHHPNAIRRQIVCDITELIYANSYQYAKAAGYFKIKFLTLSELTEKQIILKLVELSSLPRFQKMKHFFVEAFMEHDSILGDYESMMNVLLSYKQEAKKEYIPSILELMYHSIHQKLKGEPVEKRKHSISAATSPSHHEEIANIILLNLKNLFDLFDDRPDLLNCLMKILILIDYDLLSSQYSPHLTYLMKNSRKLLLHMNDEELLGNICAMFHYLCSEKNYCLKNDINKYLVSLFESLSIYLQGYLDDSGDQEVPLDLHFKKIGKLYEKFNLNEYFQWNNIFTVWGSVPICRGQLISCCHHLLWEIKDLMCASSKDRSDEYRQKKINLESQFSQYTASLIHLMASSDAAENLKIDAYENFCYLHVTSYKILFKNDELKDLKFQILQSLKTYVPDTVVKFFKNKIIHHKTMTLERRKKLIYDWLGLILNSLTDVLYLIPLFECYHMKSQEYGYLIEFVASAIFARKHEVFFQLVLATLIKLTKQVFQSSFKTLSSPQAEQLMALGLKFSNMKEFSNSSKEILRMLHLGFKHCFKDESFELLILLQYFLYKLRDEHWKDCLQIFVAMTPKELENHEYIRSFRVKLEAGKTKKIKITTLTQDSVLSGIPEESDNSVNQSAKRPKRELVKETNKNSSKAKKSLRFDDSAKENTEKKKSKKKNKTPKLGRTSKK